MTIKATVIASNSDGYKRPEYNFPVLPNKGDYINGEVVYKRGFSTTGKNVDVTLYTKDGTDQ